MGWWIFSRKKALNNGCERRFLAERLGISSYFIPPENADAALLKENAIKELHPQEQPLGEINPRLPETMWDFPTN